MKTQRKVRDFDENDMKTYTCIRSLKLSIHVCLSKCRERSTAISMLAGGGGGGGDFHMRSTRGRDTGVIFSRKNSGKGMSIFHKNSGNGYNICKKFQIGSVILMAQMTNQKMTELNDYFHLVWTKNPQF